MSESKTVKSLHILHTSRHETGLNIAFLSQLHMKGFVCLLVFHTSPASGGGVWYDIPDEELGHDSVAFQSTGFIRNETRFQMGAVYEMVLRVWNIITCPPPGSDCDYVHSQKDFFANTSNLG